MKATMNKVMGKCEELACRAYVAVSTELRRIRTEKDGGVDFVTYAIMLGAAAVIGTAIVGILKVGFPAIFQELLDKIKPYILGV